MTDNVKKYLSKRHLCMLLKAAIDEESNAAKEYNEILKLLPDEPEYKECTELISRIIDDEAAHAIKLIAMEDKLNCKRRK